MASSQIRGNQSGSTGKPLMVEHYNSTKGGTDTIPQKVEHKTLHSNMSTSEPQVAASASQAPAQATKTRKKKFQSRRSTVKVEKHRGLRSEETTSADARIALQIAVVPRSIILAISTRGIGFAIRFIVSKFATLSIRNLNFHNLCNSLYRLSLLQLEIKLMRVMANQCSRNNSRLNFRFAEVNIDFVRVAGELGAGYSPITNLITSVGLFKAFGTVFVPRISNPIRNANQIDLFDPTLVTFNSLRGYVEVLANPATPVEVRRYFYDHSPIPGAIWNQRAERRRDAAGEPIDEENFPLLLNPDEIMPPVYGLQQIHADIDILQDSIEIVAKKYPKFVHFGKVDFDANGFSTQLVSNNVEDIQCHPLIIPAPGQQPNYASNPFNGTISDYWSPEYLSDSEFYLGTKHLVGELPRDTPNHYSVRILDSAKQESDSDYVSTIQNLLG